MKYDSLFLKIEHKGDSSVGEQNAYWTVTITDDDDIPIEFETEEDFSYFKNKIQEAFEVLCPDKPGISTKEEVEESEKKYNSLNNIKKGFEEKDINNGDVF